MTDVSSSAAEMQALRDEIAALRDLIVPSVPDDSITSRPPTPPASPSLRSCASSQATLQDFTPVPSESFLVMPDKFDGDRSALSAFLHQVDFMFQTAPRRFPTDALKVAAVAQLLRGSAALWMASLVDNPDEFASVQHDYQDFKALLRTTFDDPTLSATATTEITLIRQGRDSVAKYTADFRALTARLPDWTDATFMALYRKGLSPEIGAQLLQFPKPSSFRELTTFALEADTRLLEHQLLYPSMRRPARASNAPAPPPAAESDPTVPRDQAPASRRKGTQGPLSAADREHRRQNNLCLYCASNEHFLRDCKVRKVRFSAEPAKNESRQ